MAELMEGQIDVSDIDKAELLAALYNNARVQGLGAFHATSKSMTKEEAQQLLPESEDWPYFDYLHGRVMKVHIGPPVLETRLYDQDNGSGECQRIVDELRKANAD